MIENTLHDRILFLYKYMVSPKQMGSVTPSSSFLAAKMVSPIRWDHVTAVAELGAGTGAITEFIRNSNRVGADLLLFEKDPLLRDKLKRRYPESICCSDALRIREDMENNKIEQLDAVISGLPLFNFPEKQRQRLLEEIDLALKPDGLFIAFQYSRQMKKALQERFTLETITFVPWNLPPAFVYVCRKK